MKKLAINGGDPLLPRGLEKKWPIFGKEEEEALSKVLESKSWCSAGYIGGKKVAEFEEKFSDYIGTNYATCVPNGTQALELAFRAIGIEPGNEVIVPAVSFISSATAVTFAGGIPKFVDVDPDTYQISPEAVKESINDRTKAIEPVHYGGYPADMDSIMEIARDNDLYVIEDAAEAHGTKWKGEKVGSIGDIGCFSFQQGKPLTCGEGGALTFDGEELKEKVFSLANLGRKTEGEKYKHYLPAGNYRMSEFLGSLLLAQFSRFEKQTRKRYENGEYLRERLKEIDGVGTLKDDSRITNRGYYFFFVRYDPSSWGDTSRDRFLEALKAEGVPCSTAHNDPLYQNPAYKNIDKKFLYGRDIDYSEANCPEAERIYSSEAIALGKDLLMTKENVNGILNAIQKIRENSDEL